MIKGYLYILLGLYKFKGNRCQIFFFLSFYDFKGMQQLSQVGLSLAQFARQRKEEDARAGKINHLWSMNGVLVYLLYSEAYVLRALRKKSILLTLSNLQRRNNSISS